MANNSNRNKWQSCLKNGQCTKVNDAKHNVLAKSNAQHSKIMRNVQKLKTGMNGSGRWKKVNWRKFKESRQTS
jgi:hypothetical protein